MRVAIAADHAGFSLKAEIATLISSLGHEVLDLGAHQLDPADDYPDFAARVGAAVQARQADRGILLCGSGVGACIAANKLKGIRAALCHDGYSARQSVEHDDANVLCLGPRVIGPALAAELVRTFLAARFTGAQRHVRRIAKITDLEQRPLAE